LIPTIGLLSSIGVPFRRWSPSLTGGKGGNFKRGVEGEDTTFCKTMQFLFEKKDKERIYKVVTECKRLKREKKLFGQRAFWQILPENPSEDQMLEMDDFIFNHGALQKSMGSVSMHGL